MTLTYKILPLTESYKTKLETTADYSCPLFDMEASKGWNQSSAHKFWASPRIVNYNKHWQLFNNM